MVLKSLPLVLEVLSQVAQMAQEPQGNLCPPINAELLLA